MRAALASLLVVAATTQVARADGALDETTAGNSGETSTSPAVSWFADKLAGFWDPSDRWQLRTDFIETHEYTATPGSTGLGVPGDILLGTASIEFDPTDHWSIRAVGGWSPTSTTDSAAETQLKIMKTKERASLALSSQAASETGALWLGYDTPSDRFTTAMIAGATVNDYQMFQQITGATLADGTMETVSQLSSYCSTHTCSNELKGAIAGAPASFAQLVLEGNISQTLWKNTDLGVDGAYYQYTQDPTKVGYFAAGALGRTANFGGGSGIAPYLWTVMPDLVHRWGQLMVMTSFSYGRYVDDEGIDMTATLRVQYKFKFADRHRLKVWTKLTASRDTDTTSTMTDSASASLGAQYMW